MAGRSIWKNDNYRKIWSSQAVSLAGSSITALAVPMLAILSLKATPLQIGLINAAGFSPFLLFGLFSGIWIDVLPRKLLLVLTDIVRAGALFAIPLLYYSGSLNIYYLLVIQFSCGVMSLFSDVGHQSYLPALVERDHLLDANAKLEVARSTASVAGPGLAGVLITAVGAPAAVVIDIASFLVSGATLALIDDRTPRQPKPLVAASILSQIADGISFIFRSEYLKSIALRTSFSNFFDRIISAVYLLYLTDVVHLKPAVIGVLYSTVGVGAFIGALGAASVGRRFGIGTTIVGSSVLAGGASLLFPGSILVPILTIPTLMCGHLLVGMAQPLYNVNQISLRQSITPQPYQGRMNSTMRFFVWGTIPIGSIVGGILGEIIGLAPTLLIGAIGVLLSSLWVVLSPVRDIRVIGDCAMAK